MPSNEPDPTTKVPSIRNLPSFYDDLVVRAIFDRLADGEWHDLADVHADVSPHVPASTAYRYSGATNMRASQNRDGAAQTSRQRSLQIAKGQYEAVRIRLLTHTRADRIEADPTGRDRIRLHPVVVEAWVAYRQQRQATS